MQGFLQALDGECAGQMHAVRAMKQGSDRIDVSARAAIDTTDHARQMADMALDQVRGSIQRLAETGHLSRDLAVWVREVHSSSEDVDSMLVAVRKSNGEIASIASQVNILAMNAKIEAARAGDAGKGFAIVAEAINDLSHKTRSAAEQISTTIRQMSDWIAELHQGARASASSADTLLDQVGVSDSALTEIEARVSDLRDETHKTQEEVSAVQSSAEAFLPTTAAVARFMQDVAGGVHEAHEQSEMLIDTSEQILQNVQRRGFPDDPDGPGSRRPGRPGV